MDNVLQAGAPEPIIGPLDHTRGPLDAAVTLVEYGDYSCSWSGQAHAFVGEAQRRFGGRLRFVFRHFPMRMMRDRAQQASEAAEAAGAQGRFWEMHDALFTHPGKLDDAHLVEYASAVGLDTSQFLRDMASHVHAESVRKDVESGKGLGVNTTPTFFINGVRFDHAWYAVTFLEAIERSMALAGRS